MRIVTWRKSQFVNHNNIKSTQGIKVSGNAVHCIRFDDGVALLANLSNIIT